MPKAKGKIETVNSGEVTIKKGTPEEKQQTKFQVKLEGGNITYEGWGPAPDTWKQGEEVEFEYEVKESAWEKDGVEQKTTHYNIRLPKGTPRSGGFQEVVKALTMPKISLFYDRTDQVKEYVPIKLGATVSFSAEEFDPEKSKEMVDKLTAVVDEKLEDKIAVLRGEPLPQREKAPSPSPATPTPAPPEPGGSTIEAALKKQESEDKAAEQSEPDEV